MSLSFTDHPLKDKGVTNALGLDAMPRHRWYFIKEGFSPKLVEHVVEEEGLTEGALLLDPFSGSGTVPLVGAVAGLRAHAFEVNPFLRFLSAAKLSTAAPDGLKRAGEVVLTGARNPVQSHLEGYSTFAAGNRWNRWLFPRQVLRSFEGGRRALRDVRDPRCRALAKLALIGAAMDCCNAIRDGKCLRFPKDWRDHEATARQFKACLESRVEIMCTDLKTLPLAGTQARIVGGDARKLVSQIELPFRVCVTSPPYLNSFDYSDLYRPELFLGNFVSSTRSLMKLRLRTVRSHVQASWQAPVNDQFGSLYTDCVRRLRDRHEGLWDHRLPTMVQAYFEDMETIFKGLRSRSRNDASVWLVVATSAYAGVEIPVDLILGDVAQRAGWFLREVGVLRYLRSSSQHVSHVDDVERKSVPLRESVVVLDAAPRGRSRTSTSAS